MFAPDQITVVDGIGRLHPEGSVALVEAVEFVTQAIGFCRENRISKLLVDVRRLRGMSVPTSIDRFLMAKEWAHASQGAVTIALVALPEYIDPEGFGIKVAADAGLIAGTFAAYAPALEWLASCSD